MFSTNDAGTIGYSYRGGKNELQLLSHPNQKINLRWIIGLNAKVKTKRPFRQTHRIFVTFR